MTEDSIKPISWIESVLRRPRMYTISGTFLEIHSFISGYVGGRALSNLTDPLITEWDDFCTWLRQTTETSGDEAFLRILSEAGSDEAAFAILIDHYRNFQQAL